MRVRDALALYVLAVVGLVTVGGLFARWGLPGLAATEVLLVALPSVLVGRARGDRLGLVRPRATAVLGAALVGASAWLVLAMVVLPLQERIAPTPPGLEEQLERVTSGPAWAVLLAVAIVPAICEELLCRGAIAFALRRRAGPVVAVVVSSLLFALLHGSIYRLAPTFFLGVAFAAIALRSGSVVPTMVAHALNNAAIVLVSDAPVVADAMAHNAAAVGAGAVIALTTGILLVFLRSERVR